MGTSTSSSGPNSGVPMVPPWVPPPPDGENGNDDESSDGSAGGRTEPVLLAPARRFRPSRTSLGQYARTGSLDKMRSGVGHYVGKGLGGAGTATRRFGGTAATAGRLYRALSSAPSGQVIGLDRDFDTTVLAGSTANEVMDALVEAVRPTDGTQDSEASRVAIREALSELLNRYPNSDLLNLSDPERIFAIEQYVAVDVYNRFSLDVGLAIKDNAPDASSALDRLKLAKEYIKETVASAFRRVFDSEGSLTVRRIANLVSRALQETFRVFADYVQ